ncbi:hypothetical protein PAECIP111893_00761 [Paenibacillus plantiphilus]|uniref:DUF2798 domain-containing protein n=1 Tax=Paenibacillus plantiphilus TaxID=2905650 RepID=A0ABN8G3K7_9BACL|nr:hypothetical protein [Paenibacillus plantiphilus]CAH1195811.1 hypothetical protein PAECIP111893_00761 [Paenibacillus plantiphilus]
MRILSIFILLLTFSLTLSVILDLVIGMPLAQSMRNLINFWRFMGIPAYLLLAIFIGVPLINEIAAAAHAKQKTKKPN